MINQHTTIACVLSVSVQFQKNTLAHFTFGKIPDGPANCGQKYDCDCDVT